MFFLVVGFVVIDEDIGDSYIYVIIDGLNFVINVIMGIILFVMDIEVIVIFIFNIIVQVIDLGGLFDICVVVVIIKNVNWKLYFINLLVIFSFLENMVFGILLYVLGVVDESLVFIFVFCFIIFVLVINLFFYNDIGE